MANADSGGPLIAELSRRIQAAYEWDSLAQAAPRGYRPLVARPEVQVAEETLKAYVGEYQLTPEITIIITLADGRLHAQATGQATFALSAESAETFFLPGANARITFTKGPSGDVTGMVLHQGGRDQPARKVR
jgi:hypothetical protein